VAGVEIPLTSGFEEEKNFKNFRKPREPRDHGNRRSARTLKDSFDSFKATNAVNDNRINASNICTKGVGTIFPFTKKTSMKLQSKNFNGSCFIISEMLSPSAYQRSHTAI